MVVLLTSQPPLYPPQLTGTFFGGSSIRAAGVNGFFDWTLPIAGSVGAPPLLWLYSDPGYQTLTAGPYTAFATADPTIWSVPYPSGLPAGSYWVEARVTWYGAQAANQVPYRGHVLILLANPPDAGNPPPWAPTLADIALLIPHRTVDDSGLKQYAFSGTTRPPASFVQAALDSACAEVRASFGDVAGRGGTLVATCAKYLAVSTLELALQPSSDIAADNRDDASIKEWHQRYIDAVDAAAARLRSGVIGSPRKPGVTGQVTPGYGSVRRWHGRYL